MSVQFFRRLTGVGADALLAVVAFKLRAFFCILSVSLGIAAITIIVATVEGAYKKAYDIIDIFGPDSVLILGGSTEIRAVAQRQKTITLDDVSAIRSSFPSAYFVTPMATMGGVDVSYRDHKHQTLVIGATSDYAASWSWILAEGVDLSNDDVTGRRNVCLIGQYVAAQLFDQLSPIGKTILIDRLQCRVVGVLSQRTASQMGHNINDRIIMPITTVMRKLQNESRYITMVKLRFRDAAYLKSWIGQLRDFLRQRHRIKFDQGDDFTIVSPDEIIRFLVAFTGSLVVFLGITGVVSLLVSGFVLANLFSLSVSERTNEIGIRRALGARKSDIFYQFILESTILTTAGGLIGFVLGLVSSKFLVMIAEFPIYFSWRAFVIGLGMAIVVGVVFAVAPARAAANLNPIEAIR
ncbi:multidrug ABC transporter substrate-binding protein [Candidatus Magnetobacterium bavaricum]|uniref:Multidrug ABC transporter substrate-binding protein n=1 Tax=Candidatus Magnetobacterium bavaricum TaxID=29290 RepID=A0A0F3GNR5_9BACT|nr:multidrug ABC transporter substrate-binding protein [Candidatus Magnetobacterium bavaricum]